MENWEDLCGKQHHELDYASLRKCDSCQAGPYIGLSSVEENVGNKTPLQVEEDVC